MNIIVKSMFFILLFSVIALAQQGQTRSASDAVDNAVAKLQQKVLLTDAQATQVKSLLTSNVNSLRDNKAVTSIKTKVESLLDARQKAKYSIIKDDWWAGLMKDVSETAK